MEWWLDTFEQHSDGSSVNPFHFSPPRRLDLEPNSTENTKQAENIVPVAVELEVPTPALDDGQWIIDQQNAPPENGSQLVESADPLLEWIVENSRPHAEWTREENKAFENALAVVDPLSPTFLEYVASRVPGKSILDIKTHYEALVCDVEMIESGLIELPNYLDDDNEYEEDSSMDQRNRGELPRRRRPSRGPAWTEEEHKLFLEGLGKYGKGDWRSISRFCVVNRTPSQVASHAQKYFERLQTKDCTPDFPLRPRRRSIHDVRNLTTTTTTTTVPISQLLKSTEPGQTLTDIQPTVNPLSVPLSNGNNGSNSTRERSHSLLVDGSSSSRPTISSNTATSFPPRRGQSRQKSHQQTEKAPRVARNSFTIDNIVNALNLQKAAGSSHGSVGYQDSTIPSLGISSGSTTTSFQSVKRKNHQEPDEQALRPHKSITIGNMVNVGNIHTQSHDFLNDHHGSALLPPTTTTISYPSARLQSPIQSAHSHEALLPQTSFSYHTSRINANTRLERRERFLLYHHSTFSQSTPASRSTSFPVAAGSSTTIQQQYSTAFLSSSSFTPPMTSTTIPLANTTTINQQYSTVFPSSSSITPPMTTTAFPMAGSSRNIALPSSSSFTPPLSSTTFHMAGTTINQQYSTTFPSSSSFSPQMASTAFPMGGTPTINQQYSIPFPSSSSFTPQMPSTAFPMGGTTTINEQHYSTAFPSSSSFTPQMPSTAFPMAGRSRPIAFPSSPSFTPPMPYTTFPMIGGSSTTINHQYSTTFPTSSSYTPPLTSTTFPSRDGPLSRLMQPYSNASPSSSLLTPPTNTTISMAGRTTINQHSSISALPTSSSLPDPSQNWYQR